MGKIESIRHSQARIILDDCYVRLFVKYSGKYCSEIRIWKLPKSHIFLSMFNPKNIFWAVYSDEAKSLHGWFYKDGDLISTLAHKIEKCANEKDLKRLCLNLENIITKGTPIDIDDY
jgi:hypothetical protein